MPSPALLPFLTVSRLPDRTLLTLGGCDTLDEQSTPAVKERLSSLPEGAGRLVLDLGCVRYATSTGLGMLAAFNRRVRTSGGRLTLANATPAVRESLAITRLDTLIEVLPVGSLPALTRTA